ncbi:sensor domain-containing protein [Streptomyces sp. NPDC058657]|uniref:sensor histidine kinase n=1 Tax=unclassified Streptomyces TaxID=2593676 RepID=UPI0036639544
MHRRLLPPGAQAVRLRTPAHARTLLYALLALPFGLVGAVLVLAGLLAGGALAVTAPGPWLIAATVRGAAGLGSLQRGLARRLRGADIEDPVRAEATGLLGWRRSALADRAGWRAVGWACAAPLLALPALVAATVGYVYGLLFLLHPLLQHVNYQTVHGPDGRERHVSLELLGVQLDTWPRWVVVVLAGALLLAAAPWLVRRALVPYDLVLRALLGPGAADRRIRTLEETRAQAVEDTAATLRRIERDLHDGTQARLVGLGMHLTMIRELVVAGADRDRLLAVVETARGNATQAVADLRHLVKGIHPPVLDQGLDAALATLAADCPLAVCVRVRIAVRPYPALESIAYFCTAELLANAAKHSGAGAVDVEVTADGGRLTLRVRDDGRGGAVVGAGSGLSGLLGRIRAVDGTLECDSPAGGPTVITVVLPCS